MFGSCTESAAARTDLPAISAAHNLSLIHIYPVGRTDCDDNTLDARTEQHHDQDDVQRQWNRTDDIDNTQDVYKRQAKDGVDTHTLALDAPSDCISSR